MKDGERGGRHEPAPSIATPPVDASLNVLAKGRARLGKNKLRGVGWAWARANVPPDGVARVPRIDPHLARVRPKDRAPLELVKVEADGASLESRADALLVP